MLLSPSRGEGTPGELPRSVARLRFAFARGPLRLELTQRSPARSLTDRVIQDRFRAHINTKMDMLAQVYPPSPSAELAARRREDVGIILLDLRKLREGLTAARRVDELTLGVYIDSIRLAVDSANLPQLNATLPHFVFDILPKLAALPPPVDQPGGDPLVDALAGLSLKIGPMRLSAELVAFYQSLYLLYLICHLADLAAFHSTLSSFAPTTQSQAPLAAPPTLASSAAPMSAHLLYTQRVFAALASSNYVAFSRLVPAPSSRHARQPIASREHVTSFAPVINSATGGYLPSELHLFIARLAVPRVREQAWAALVKSYKVFTDHEWLGRALLFASDEQEEVKAYLKGKGVAVV